MVNLALWLNNMPDIWGLLAIAIKFTLYLGALTAVGTVIVALLFRLNHYRSPCLIFGGIGLLAAIIAFLLRGANLTGDASGLTDPEMLSLLWSTPVGTVLVYRIAGLGLLIVGLYLGRAGLWVSAVGGVIAMWSFAHIGHVAARENTFIDLTLIFHLIVVSFWIGILIPLKRLVSSPPTFPDAAELGHKFGLVATVTVPLLIAAGGYMSYVLVGSLNALISTGYGQVLILKVVFVGGLLALAAANKLRFIPRLREGDPKAAAHLATSINMEWLLIIMVLGATAVLTSNLTLPT